MVSYCWKVSYCTSVLLLTLLFSLYTSISAYNLPCMLGTLFHIDVLLPESAALQVLSDDQADLSGSIAEL